MTVNLYEEGGWDVERQHGGGTWRLRWIGRRIGAELLGATLFEASPGTSGRYHAHHGNEEWVLVLAGKPTLRTPEGERELAPGDVAVFRRGGDGAHELGNRSDEPARFLVLSTMVEPDVVEYLDADVLGLIAGAPPVAGRDAPLEAFFRRSASIPYSEIE